MIVRNRGGDALGLMSALLFLLVVMKYLIIHHQFIEAQKHEQEIKVNSIEVLLYIAPSAIPILITSLLFFVFFLRFSRAPLKFSKLGLWVWFGFSLFLSLGISLKFILPYFFIIGCGFLFLYSSRIQALRLEEIARKK